MKSRRERRSERFFRWLKDFPKRFRYGFRIEYLYAFIFITALLIFFFNVPRIFAPKQTTAISTLKKSTLPIIYFQIEEGRSNEIRAFRSSRYTAAADDLVTILPEDRNLTIYIENETEIPANSLSVNYEIRSYDDQKTLIERTAVTNISAHGKTIEAKIRVEALLTKGSEYQMTIILDSENYGGKIYYFTRLLTPNRDYYKQMLEIARNFTKNTFNYDDARPLAVYLEPNPNSDSRTLATVTLESTFDQITWGRSGMKLEGEILTNIIEADGLSLIVNLDYVTSTSIDSLDSVKTYYYNTDKFVLRWDEVRIYLMKFERKTEEIFTNRPMIYERNKILLGITNTESFQSLPTASSEFISFTKHKDLWRFDVNRNRFLNIFTYRDTDPTDFRYIYNKHDIKILNTQTNGDVDFIVYGYVNRGSHEGNNGILFYTYDNSEDVLIENFFVPIYDNYSNIKYDTNQLSYLSLAGDLCFLSNNCVYTINKESKSLTTNIDNLKDLAYAVSGSGRCIAYMNNSRTDSDTIYLYDFETNDTQVIRESGNPIIIHGFMYEDLMYGIQKSSQPWVENGRYIDTLVDEFKFFDSQDGKTKSYTQDGYCFAGVSFSQDRTHYNRYKRENGKVKYVSYETIVNSFGDQNPKQDVTETLITREKLRISALPIDPKFRGQLVSGSTKRLIETTDSSYELERKEREKGTFLAMQNGDIIAKRKRLTLAVDDIYEDCGYVKDISGNMIWNRTNKANLKYIREVLDTAGIYLREIKNLHEGSYYFGDYLLIDCFELSTNAVLNYVSDGLPALLYLNDGDYMFISGYDNLLYKVTRSDGDSTMYYKSDIDPIIAESGNNFIACMKIAHK